MEERTYRQCRELAYCGKPLAGTSAEKNVALNIQNVVAIEFRTLQTQVAFVEHFYVVYFAHNGVVGRTSISTKSIGVSSSTETFSTRGQNKNPEAQIFC